jgi:hypothetical protein
VEVTKEALARFFDVVLPHMNEVQRRVVAGAASEMLGRGGKTAVATASDMSRNTVIKAETEVGEGTEPTARLRAPGGGDKALIDRQPGLLEALDELLHPESRGSPMSLLRWTSKSSTNLAEDLVRQGFGVSSRTVQRLLHRLGYSLQANAKVTEGRQHPDRDARLRYLNDIAAGFIDDDQPVISVDTKKKELIGDYANGGTEWEPEGEPERVQVHDFADRALGEFAMAIPYGIYDVANDEGWVSVGDVADTAEFAVESIRRWWNQMGQARFPAAVRLLVTADAGGSNAWANRSPVYSPPLSEWKITPVTSPSRTAAAMHNAALASGASWCSPIAKPGSRREARSSTMARYSLPSSVGISVRSPHHFWLICSAVKSRPIRSGSAWPPCPGGSTTGACVSGSGRRGLGGPSIRPQC